MERLFAKSSRTSTSAVAENFTEDIIREILLSLPAKSLMRFKCVCKRWRSLISDPAFAKSHLQRLKAGDLIPGQRIIAGGCFSPLETIDCEALDGGGEGRVVVPHTIKPSWKPRVMGSCDGLVCLLVPGNFLIYNPTTREHRELPASNIDLDHDFIREGDLFFGFGYDSRSDDYKIVEGLLDEKWEVAIYSLKSGSWRVIEFQFEEESHADVLGKAVYWNGALHWQHWRIRMEIMSFDISEEKFDRKLSVPEARDIDFTQLVIHGASLSIYGIGHDHCMEVWIRDEYGGSWTKLFRFDCVLPGSWHSVLAYTRSGKMVILINEKRLILFNPEDGTYKDYPTGLDDFINNFIEYAIYLETLVSPHLGGEPSRIQSL